MTGSLLVKDLFLQIDDDRPVVGLAELFELLKLRVRGLRLEGDEGEPEGRALVQILIGDLGDRDVRSAISWRGRGSQDVNNNPSFCRDAQEISPERPTIWCAPGETNCTPPQRLVSDSRDSRGGNWANFRATVTQVFTTLPPNKPPSRWPVWSNAIGP